MIEFSITPDVQQQIDKVIKALKDDADEFFQELVLQTHGELKENSKGYKGGDTGHMRNNWLIGVGAPRDEVYGSRKEPQSAPDGGGISKIVPGLLGKTVYLNNNAPYTGFVNDGTSMAPPVLFIEKALVVGPEKAMRKFVRGI